MNHDLECDVNFYSKIRKLNFLKDNRQCTEIYSILFCKIYRRFNVCINYCSSCIHKLNLIIIEKQFTIQTDTQYIFHKIYIVDIVVYV